MSFLKSMFSKDNTDINNDTVPKQGETDSFEDQEKLSVNNLENNNSGQSPVIFMNRLFHNQKLPLFEGPETIYENEAWAPVSEFIGLFRRRRVN